MSPSSRRRAIAEKKTKKKASIYVLPSLFTTGNLLAGFYALLSCYNGYTYRAAVAILVAILLDILDGKIARLTRTASEFGKEYDSLADFISFGVAPAALLYVWALRPYGRVGWLAALLFVICSALRLARFNVMSRESPDEDFIGLPAPAAAGVVASTVILDEGILLALSSMPLLLALMSYFLAFLMVSTLRYRSFKHVNVHKRHPFNLVVGLALTVIIFVVIPQIAVFIIMMTYTLSGPFEKLLQVRRAQTSTGLAKEEEP